MPSRHFILPLIRCRRHTITLTPLFAFADIRQALFIFDARLLRLLLSALMLLRCRLFHVLLLLAYIITLMLPC